MHNIHWSCAGANMVRFRLLWRTYALYIDIVGWLWVLYSPSQLGNIHKQTSLSVSSILQSFIFKSNIERERQIKNTFLIANKANIPTVLQDEDLFYPLRSEVYFVGGIFDLFH